MGITLRDIEKLDPGAQFLNADLHIHSYGGSADVKDASMTPKAIIEAALAQRLSVIALTDHNSDANVAEAIALAQPHADKLLVLAGVEITSAHGHVLVYFQPERLDVLSRFLAKLDIKGAKGAADSHTAMSMADVIAQADALGGICIAAHIDRDKTGFEMLAPGYPNWKKDILTSSGLYGLECDAKEALLWYSPLDPAGSAGAERRKLLQARAAVAELVARSELAHLQCSDAHSLTVFQHAAPDKKWTRLKLNELSFGAVRTALIDPTARVVARASVPQSFPKVRGMATTGGFVESVAAQYSTGLSFSVLEKEFDKLCAPAGTPSADPTSVALLKEMRAIIDGTNTALKQKETETNAALKAQATALLAKCQELKSNHAKMDGAVAIQVAALKAQGLDSSIAGLEQLMRQRNAVATEISTIEQRSSELNSLRTQRKGLLEELARIRGEMTRLRKQQLADINNNLAITITDYKVFVKYEDSGIIDTCLQYVTDQLAGTYLQENAARQICEKVMPADLASMIRRRDTAAIVAATGISQAAAEKLIGKLCYWRPIFELETLAKAPKPTITVLTRSTPARAIPVAQLSDGQRHTIFLTIAMLAESNVPLVIDQPEDDLDNAFIFASIVTTLRTIKERRQVILITHNANIAVLGDSEQIFPMCRENDSGKSVDRGSIDKESTKRQVQNILEGGAEAFRRRQEMYGH